MYALLRNALFLLPTETSHDVALKSLACAQRLKLLSVFNPAPRSCPVTVMGLEFANPVGLAAGLDKNGDYIDPMMALGFGFVEIGTVTPRPQSGNAKPRLFRLPEHRAIINRMGFNNCGVDHLVEQVRRCRGEGRLSTNKGVLGINIGKNFDTPVERAAEDYLLCMDKVYAHADYITVNISSPNTPGLRSLQFGDDFNELLASLKARQQVLADEHGRYVPLAVKIAPDMSDDELKQLGDVLLGQGIDAVIATNTTVSREAVADSPLSEEAGGLSGAPLRERSTEVVKILSQHLAGALPIIAVGGILSADDAVEKMDAGAALVQIYSGFIYSGPGLIRAAVQAIAGRP
ncbi:MAG: quinone-dependent dihydroorotate dehydrogenase [Porticoccaceae bacterium]|nr:quinone-dependent dihydroorotate dehydrogenase [Porticoccaceae bacterium]